MAAETIRLEATTMKKNANPAFVRIRFAGLPVVVIPKLCQLLALAIAESLASYRGLVLSRLTRYPDLY
jgi:hypothetical protein